LGQPTECRSFSPIPLEIVRVLNNAFKLIDSVGRYWLTLMVQKVSIGECSPDVTYTVTVGYYSSGEWL